MPRRARRAIAAAAVALVGGAEALAHGGAYRGVVQEPPPDLVEPGPPPTPEEAAARQALLREMREGWRVWWGVHSDTYLLDRAARAPHPSAPRWDQVAERDVVLKVVPALRALLSDRKEHFDVRAAAALALARTGDASVVPELEAIVVNAKHEEHRVVQETAALALGLLGKDTDEVRSLLIETAVGAVPGQDQGRTSFVRPFAALSLGLLAGNAERDRAAAEALSGVVSSAEPTESVKPAALLAMGLLGDPALPELLAVATTRRTTRKDAVEVTDRERSYAVAALGRIGRAGIDGAGREAAVADGLLRILGEGRPDEHRAARRAAVAALGRVGGAADETTRARIVGLLSAIAASADGDPCERNVARIALAHVVPPGDADRVVRATLFTAFRKTLASGPDWEPCFAALALGLSARRVTDAGGPAPEADALAPIRAKFAADADPIRRGAYAIASGLARDAAAVPALRAVVADTGQAQHLRGSAAQALALIGDAASAADLRSAVAAEESPREFVWLALPALALLTGDDADGATLRTALVVLRNGESPQVALGAAVQALGTLRNPRAIEPLLTVAADTKNQPDLTRAFAVAALGRLCERRDLSPLARLAAGVDFRSQVPAIQELLTIL